jgi:D-inositol-3-phosphate glycosyltransferase
VLVVGGESGSQGEMERLREQATALGVDHHVSFVGVVEQEKLPLFYSAADVCVVPSFYESFGLVAIEAMACGTPVVASRVGGLTASVRDGETGYLVAWRCAEPFAERLELLLGNEELRRALGRAAREEAGRFRWANVAEGVLEVYGGLREVRRQTPPAGRAEPLLTPGG